MAVIKKNNTEPSGMQPLTVPVNRVEILVFSQQATFGKSKLPQKF